MLDRMSVWLLKRFQDVPDQPEPGDFFAVGRWQRPRPRCYCEALNHGSDYTRDASIKLYIEVSGNYRGCQGCAF